LVKILKFFDADADPGSGIFLTVDPGWKKFGSGINILDPQHWLSVIKNLDLDPDSDVWTLVFRRVKNLPCRYR
jgi:hypothetical protein